MNARFSNRKTLFAVLAAWAILPWSAAQGEEAEKPEYLSGALRERIVSARQQWGELGLNTATKPPRGPGRKLRIKDQRYGRGLGAHARSEIVVDLAGEFATFEAEVGLQWNGGKTTGSVVFQVFVDGEKRFDSGVMRESDPPKKVSVSVEDALELRLMVSDAGDGINSDVADWAEARLTRLSGAKAHRPRESVNVAPFARVVTSDPKRMHGTKTSRSQEFPAEDLWPCKELVPGDDKSYTVPVDPSGTGCIGLEWREFRYLREVGLRFADPAAVPENVQLQYWTGRSSWQGEWKTLQATVTRGEDGCAWRLGYQDRNKPTDKIRWIFPASNRPIVVTGMRACTTSLWKTASLRLEREKPSSGGPIEIDVYNGEFVGDEDKHPRHHLTWDGGAPLQVTVRHAVTHQCKTDQTVLRVRTADQAFGVGVEDVLANEAVYVPTAGLFVTRDPAPVTLAEYKKNTQQKTLRRQIEELPEQTLARAMEVVHCPIQENGPTMVSLACDQRKYVAYRDGSVGFNRVDRPSATFDGKTHRGMRRWQYRLRPEFGDGTPEKLSRRLDGRWLPLPVTTVDEDGVVYRARTYVAPLDDEPPAGAPAWLRRRAVCVAEYTIENTRSTEAEALLELSLRDQSKKGNGRKITPKTVDGGATFAETGRLLAFLDTGAAAPLEMKADADKILLVGTLPAGAKARCVAYMPAWRVAPGEHAPFRGLAPGLAEKTKRYWEAIMAPGAKIELPDELLTDVVRASQVHIMLAAGNEENGSRIDVWTSADRYGSLESESQPIIRGMDMMGQRDFARRGLDFFIARYNEAGFLTTGYTVMGSGWHLWTLAEFVDRAENLDWFKRVAPEVARMCRWIARQREKTKRLDAAGEKVPNHGLTPPGVIADWARFTNTTFQAAHYCTGLREAARVLAKIDHPDAPALAKEAEDYREDILHAYRWTQARSPVVPRGDGTWVPAQPPIFFIFGEVGGFFPGEDGSRAWCKNAMAHHLMVNRILDPNSEETSWMLDIMEGIEFLRSGLAEPDYNAERNHELWFDLGGFNKCQPYYRRSVELYALRDEVKPFIRGYFNTFPAVLNLENLTFWEHFHNRGGWNKTHETGWFLTQTRLMLLQERGDELWLAPFVTRNWLKDGMTVNVENAPTRFGKAGYRIDSAVDGGTIEVAVDPPTARSPSRIVLRLRHPDAKPIRSVTVDEKPHKDFDPKAETITLVPGAKRLNVRVTY